MDMKVDAKRIREQRTRKACSQEHLAEVTGLGLRTIQRIEKNGNASNESIAAIASVFATPAEEYLVANEPEKSLFERLANKRIAVLILLNFITLLVTPPQLSAQLPVLTGMWLCVELFVAYREKNKVKAWCKQKNFLAPSLPLKAL